MNLKFVSGFVLVTLYSSAKGERLPSIVEELYGRKLEAFDGDDQLEEVHPEVHRLLSGLEEMNVLTKADAQPVVIEPRSLQAGALDFLLRPRSAPALCTNVNGNGRTNMGMCTARNNQRFQATQYNQLTSPQTPNNCLTVMDDASCKMSRCQRGQNPAQTFYADNAGRLLNDRFGQACMTMAGDTMYMARCNGNDQRQLYTPAAASPLSPLQVGGGCAKQQRPNQPCITGNCNQAVNNPLGMFTYTSDNGNILSTATNNPGSCLTANANGFVVMSQCAAGQAAQTFAPDNQRRLVNAANGQCLASSSNNLLATRNCNGNGLRQAEQSTFSDFDQYSFYSDQFSLIKAVDRSGNEAGGEESDNTIIYAAAGGGAFVVLAVGAMVAKRRKGKSSSQTTPTEPSNGSVVSNPGYAL